MPIYDYTCGACGHTVEVIHGIHDGGPRFCPACGVDGRMKKAFNAPTVHFKGSGWAKKDRSASATSGRSKSRDGAAGSDAASGTGAADGTSGSTGSTPGASDGAAATPAGSATTTAGSDTGSTGSTTGGE